MTTQSGSRELIDNSRRPNLPVDAAANRVRACLAVPRVSLSAVSVPPSKWRCWKANSWVLVEYKVRIEAPKSRNGKRTLPLDDALVTALTQLRKCQMQESADAGTAYRASLDALDWYQGGEYVITDQLGSPVHPEWYSDEFGRLLKRAGLRRITLHDSRHTTLTLMEHAGVPIAARHSPGYTRSPKSCEKL